MLDERRKVPTQDPFGRPEGTDAQARLPVLLFLLFLVRLRAPCWFVIFVPPHRCPASGALPAAGNGGRHSGLWGVDVKVRPDGIEECALDEFPETGEERVVEEQLVLDSCIRGRREIPYPGLAGIRRDLAVDIMHREAPGAQDGLGLI